MSRSFWFYAATHAARMMNTIPGKFKGRLALPFMLVHGVDTMSVLGLLSSLFAIFITKRMMTS
jgi:hypothetical protein